ncbi:restriction endonuclease subunit S [Streptomyces pseudogriseolus]|uniref:restriction endonuclease subunit S n=1 Tax=Streptomyces pseudogriseolus TaxID=36817 RepID=UPI003FA2B35F
MGGEWPDGWTRMPLADAGKWLSGGTPSTANSEYWDGDIPWISAASLKEFRIAHSDRRVTPLGASNGSRLVSEGTVLFVVRGMSLKSEFRIGVTERTVAFGQDCKAIVAADGIDPYFLAHAVQARTPEILAMVEETSHGTGRLDTERLQELEIGVPPLAEQRRIVAAHAVVERRISALERVRAKLKVAEAALISEKLAEVSERITLSSWIRRIEAGKSPLVEDTPAGNGEWGVLKVSAVHADGFLVRENKVVRDPAMINPQFEVRHGDLLMTRANTENLVGLACVVENPPSRLMLSDKTLRLVVDDSMADAKFVAAALSSNAVRVQIKAAATGTSGSMKNISQGSVKRLLVPDVPRQEQRKIQAALSVGRQRVEVVQKQIAKLRTVQSGLMEDLLVGETSLSLVNTLAPAAG